MSAARTTTTRTGEMTMKVVLFTTAAVCAMAATGFAALIYAASKDFGWPYR